MWMEVEPIFGYEFADKISITFNGELLKAEYHPDYNLCIVTAPITHKAVRSDKKNRIIKQIEKSTIR